MGRHAKSDAAKRIDQQKIEMALYDRAVLAYRAELAKPKGEKRHGLRAVWIAIEKLHFEETGKVVKLHHTRLNHYVDGGKTRVEANAHRCGFCD